MAIFPAWFRCGLRCLLLEPALRAISLSPNQPLDAHTAPGGQGRHAPLRGCSSEVAGWFFVRWDRPARAALSEMGLWVCRGPWGCMLQVLPASLPP